MNLMSRLALVSAIFSAMSTGCGSEGAHDPATSTSTISTPMPVSPSAVVPSTVAASVTQPQPNAQPLAGAAGAPPPSPPSNPNAIVSVAFRADGGIAGNGGLSQPEPLVLFASGDAKADASLVLRQVDVAAEVLREPREWRKWRRNPSGEVEIEVDGIWKPLTYKYEAKPQPAGTKIQGTFEYVLSSLARNESKRYQFEPDGKFAACDSTVSEARRASAGTYSVTGYALQMASRFVPPPIANAPTAPYTYPFFYVPEIGAVWVDGQYYPAQPEQKAKALCGLPPLDL